MASSENKTVKDSRKQTSAQAEKTVVLHTSSSPVVQKKAQQEKSNITSFSLLSSFQDRSSLLTSQNREEDEINFLGESSLKKYTNIPIDFHADPQTLYEKKETYENLEIFNEGGQGIISAAKESSLGRIVAIKTLRKEQNTEAAVNNFISEAKVTAQLDHPAIIPIYSLNWDEKNGFYQAMKLVNGKSLRDYLKNVVLQHRVKGQTNINEYAALGRRLEIFLSVCDAIAYAHHRGFMHCDLKPENIMIGEFNEVYVMDWGIAKPIPKGHDPNWKRPEFIEGTPRYLSPESARGEEYDHRSDIFALGLILQEIVTLSYAVNGENNEKIMQNISDGNFEPVEHKYGLPLDADLVAVIRKATALQKEDRYQSVKELSEDIRAYIQGNEVSANPDNKMAKVIRWTTHHQKGMLVTLLISALLVFVMISYSIYTALMQTRLLQERSLAVSLAYSKCLQAVSTLDRAFLSEQKDLLKIRELTEHFLSAPPRKTKLNFLVYDKDGKLPGIPDSQYSVYYSMDVSLDYGVVKLLHNTGLTSQMKQQLEHLNPIIPTLKESILNSVTDLSIPSRSHGVQRILNSGAMIKSFYLGLEKNGLYIGYPCRDSVNDRMYDPRLRTWYKDAQNSTVPVWGKPYVGSDRSAGLCLPCSVAMRDKSGTRIGVIGMDLTFTQISKALNKLGNSGSYVKETALIDMEGRVIVSTRDGQKTYYSEKEAALNQAVQMQMFDVPSIRHRIRNSSFGIIAMNTQQGEMLYLFARFKTLPWTYVVKIDVRKYLDAWNEGKVTSSGTFDLLDKKE